MSAVERLDKTAQEKMEVRNVFYRRKRDVNKTKWAKAQSQYIEDEKWSQWNNWFGPLKCTT